MSTQPYLSDLSIQDNVPTIRAGLGAQPKTMNAAGAVDLNSEHTQFIGGATYAVTLPDGQEGQRHTFAMLGSGTVTLSSPTTKLPGTTVSYAFNGADALSLIWLAGKWRLVFNDGAVAA